MLLQGSNSLCFTPNGLNWVPFGAHFFAHNSIYSTPCSNNPECTLSNLECGYIVCVGRSEVSEPAR